MHHQPRTSNLRLELWAFIAIVVAIFAAVFFFGRWGGDRSPGTFIGVIVQSGSSASDGIVIEARRADFSSTAVDVELIVSAEGAGLATVTPAGATLRGISATSAYTASSGTTLLRFPAEAWTGRESDLPLLVDAVQVDEGSSGKNIPGAWLLEIAPPVGDDAEAARELVSLNPFTFGLRDAAILVTAFRSPDATYLRYELPPGVGAKEGPQMPAAADYPLRGRRSGTGPVPGFSEVRFDIAVHEPVSLVFDNLYRESDAPRWSITLALAPFDRPGEEQVRHDVEWRLEASVEAPEVANVTWMHRRSDADLQVTFVERWGGGSIPPTVLGDGNEMRVFAHNSTHVSIRLGENEDLPRKLVLLRPPKESPVPDIHLILRP